MRFVFSVKLIACKILRESSKYTLIRFHFITTKKILSFAVNVFEEDLLQSAKMIAQINHIKDDKPKSFQTPHATHFR